MDGKRRFLCRMKICDWKIWKMSLNEPGHKLSKHAENRREFSRLIWSDSICRVWRFQLVSSPDTMTEKSPIHAKIYGWIADLFLDFMRSRRKSMSVRNARHLTADGFIPVCFRVKMVACKMSSWHFAKLAQYKNILVIYMDLFRLCNIKKFGFSAENSRGIGLKYTCLTFVSSR